MSKVSKEHHSRFSSKRIEYTLKTQVKPFAGRDGGSGYYVKKGGQDNLAPSSSFVWTDASLSARADIPGNATMKTQQGATVFTGETGASLTYYQDGSLVFAASADSPVSRRGRLAVEQA